MYSAIELSKYIITKCDSDANPISNLQLQKILFFIQKDYLKRGKVAFNDPIEAWQFGPVVPSSYYRFCGYGAMQITQDYNTDISDEDMVYLDPIISKRSKMSPWALVRESHKPGGAWHTVYNDGKGNHEVIPTKLIAEEQ